MENKPAYNIIQPGDPEYYLPENQEALDELYRKRTPSKKAVLQLADNSLQTFELKDDEETRFNVLRFMPEDPDGSVIYIFAEFGFGKEHIAGIIRALSVQRLANPSAIIMLQLNDSFDTNMNFTDKERQELYDGNTEAYSSRINAAYAGTPGVDRDAPLTLVGFSQGATIAGKVAADGKTPASAALIVEAPNVENRLRANIGLRFVFSGGNAKKVIDRNGYPEDDAAVTIKNDLLHGLDLSVLAQEYGRPVLRRARTNLMLAKLMVKATLEDDMFEALAKRGVVSSQVWATGDKISKAELNRGIANRLGALGLVYASTEVAENDHSVTNDNQLMAMFVRELYEMLEAA